MVDGAEAVRHVGVEHPVRSPVGLDPDSLDGHLRRAPRAKPVALGQEVGLEDGFEDDLGRRHHHPVTDTGYAEGPGGSRLPRLRDMHPPERLGAIGLRLQLTGEGFEELPHPGVLDVLDRHTVDAGGSSVGCHVIPCSPQDVAAGDVGEQGMEPTGGI